MVTEDRTSGTLGARVRPHLTLSGNIDRKEQSR
jgi:hypothetical protein